ncbi:MAG: hypothetical protein IKC50_01810, partial [Oscillospiraceae bacterium]|nr:hypothetical protein [Oscillospiraceae bacterium]
FPRGEGFFVALRAVGWTIPQSFALQMTAPFTQGSLWCGALVFLGCGGMVFGVILAKKQLFINPLQNLHAFGGGVIV